MVLSKAKTLGLYVCVTNEHAVQKYISQNKTEINFYCIFLVHLPQTQDCVSKVEIGASLTMQTC